jgi:tetratricopeptide (TPR) repeat protein
MELKINPYYDNCYANRGLLYYKMGKMDQAIADWKKTLEINPNYNSVLHNLAVYYYEQKNFSEAIFYAQEIVDRGFPLQLELQRLLQPTSFLQLPAVNLKK